MKLKVQRPRGMKDIFDDEAVFYLKIRDLITQYSFLNSFKYIETPLVENENVYTLSLGNTSDVVRKEMFYLKSKEKCEKYVLRPEGTAGVVRAYFENGMISLPQPVNLFYFGKMYRYERPQHGRLREHTQWGLEILNSEDYFADFFIIYAFVKFLRKINIKDVVVKLNSLGCPKCQKKYKRELVKYYNQYKKKICLDCQQRLKVNPLRLLDCKDENDQKIKEGAPSMLDYLCKFCKNHFQKVLDNFERFKIPYELDKTLVRGFDYYSRTVFEFFVERENFALGGGGRYDLGEIIGNIPLPSVGGALGIERLKIVLDELKISFKKPPAKIFIAYAGEDLRSRALEIYEELQENNFAPQANFFKISLANQLEYANKLGLKYSLILGFQELSKETIILKDMEYGTQEFLKIKTLVKELKRILKERK